MAVAKSIVAISIPFVSGVASAALLPQGWSYGWTAALCCVVLVFLLAFVSGKGNRTPALMALYYLLGIFCYSSACLREISLPMHTSGLWPENDPPRLASSAMDRMTSIIDSCGFSERTASLVKALLTGSRVSLSKDIVAVFRKSGASHILALSGLHLGVIYALLNRLLGVTGNSFSASRLRSAVIVAFCFLYTIVTGASPSIVRAFLFVLFNELSRQQPGRRHDPLASLCAAATVQLVLNPLVINSIGFQLSYLAMIGIFTVYPILRSWYPEPGGHSPLTRMDPARYIWNSASLAMSCQLFTAPLVWIKFHTFPVWFLLSNLLAMPLSSLLIICSLFALMIHLPFITEATDFLASTMIFVLEVISGM